MIASSNLFLLIIRLVVFTVGTILVKIIIKPKSKSQVWSASVFSPLLFAFIYGGIYIAPYYIYNQNQHSLYSTKFPILYMFGGAMATCFLLMLITGVILFALLSQKLNYSLFLKETLTNAHEKFNSRNYLEAISILDGATHVKKKDRLSICMIKADSYLELKRPEKAVFEWDKYLCEQHNDSFGYYQRGYCKTLTNDISGAIADFTKAIELNPKDSDSYAARGNIYGHMGRRSLADEDFKHVIEIEEQFRIRPNIHFAYQALGNDSKAIDAINVVLNENPQNPGNNYNAACLYSRMKDKTKALLYLEKALQYGFNCFAQLEHDHDINFLRESDEYKALIDKYCR